MDATKSKVFRVYEPPFLLKILAHKHQRYNSYSILNSVKIEYRRYEKVSLTCGSCRRKLFDKVCRGHFKMKD